MRESKYPGELGRVLTLLASVELFPAFPFVGQKQEGQEEMDKRFFVLGPRGELSIEDETPGREKSHHEEEQTYE